MKRRNKPAFPVLEMQACQLFANLFLFFHHHFLIHKADDIFFSAPMAVQRKMNQRGIFIYLDSAFPFATWAIQPNIIHVFIPSSPNMDLRPASDHVSMYLTEHHIPKHWNKTVFFGDSTFQFRESFGFYHYSPCSADNVWLCLYDICLNWELSAFQPPRISYREWDVFFFG